MARMRCVVVLAITLAVAGATVRGAQAHVAPSQNDNNRYLKLTPLADRIRLAYTVFFGEVPGERARVDIDTDHDGTISQREAQTFGDRLAAEVAANLAVEVDGIQRPIEWEAVDVGMGSPSATAGAFSVDLVTRFCLSDETTHHAIVRDRYRIPNPGETEVRIDDGLGIRVVAARVGTTEDPRHIYRFLGPGGPLSDAGIDLQFEVGDEAPRAATRCSAPGHHDSKHHGLPPLLVIAASALAAFTLAVVLTRLWRRREAR
jgi:hypothetical protein